MTKVHNMGSNSPLWEGWVLLRFCHFLRKAAGIIRASGERRAVFGEAEAVRRMEDGGPR